MICCLNPDCQHPLNSEIHDHCQQCGTPLIPLLRNRYRITKPLGRGGFGKTYLAEDTDKLQALCVVKQLAYLGQVTPAILEKIEQLFQQEAQQLYLLEGHAQIPTLLASFKENAYLYLVQQYVEGQTLQAELNQEGPFPETKIGEILAGMLPVLEFIHSKGVIHRDLKPENIMRRWADNQCVLIDFGVAKHISATSATLMGTQLLSGTQLGSHGYAPLEQIETCKVHPASDLYSLGVTCFHLLSGMAPDQLQLRYGYSWFLTGGGISPSPLKVRYWQRFWISCCKQRFRTGIAPPPKYSKLSAAQLPLFKTTLQRTCPP